jgi:hypothetical protein
MFDTANYERFFKYRKQKEAGEKSNAFGKFTADNIYDFLKQIDCAEFIFKNREGFKKYNEKLSEYFDLYYEECGKDKVKRMSEALRVCNDY